MKSVKELIQKVADAKIFGNENVSVSHLTYDSRSVGEGSMFFAVRGTQFDGHQFMADVIAKGAAAIVCEVLPEEIDATVTYIKVNNTLQSD